MCKRQSCGWLCCLLILMTLPPMAAGSDREDAPSRMALDPLLPRGYGISPFGFPEVFDDPDQLPEAMMAFLADLQELPNPVMMWNGAWREDLEHGSDSGEIPESAIFVQLAAADFDLIPVAVFGWRSGSTLYLNTPEDPENSWSNAYAPQLYEAMLQGYAETYTPVIMLLGNENDFYYQQDPGDYANWIAAYNAAYDAIKSESAETLVGPVFNFEHLAGSGGLNDWDEPVWTALDLHDLDRVDVIALTVYPWLGHVEPGDIPADYLQPVLDRIGEIPIVITETAWPATDPAGLEPLWTISPEAQVAYVKQLPAIISGTPVLGLLWPWLNSPVSLEGKIEWALFGGIGLIDSEGNPRPAYSHWLLMLDRIFFSAFE